MDIDICTDVSDMRHVYICMRRNLLREPRKAKSDVYTHTHTHYIYIYAYIDTYIYIYPSALTGAGRIPLYLVG